MADIRRTTTFLSSPDDGYSPSAGRRIAPSSRRPHGRSRVAAPIARRSGRRKRPVVADKRATDRHESKLVQARLGMASGLHAALRAKHPPTASHCLRVALGCSSWAAVMELDDETRDVLEVAALLHDVGKIGVPDKVLLKPGRLLAGRSRRRCRATRRSRSRSSPAAACPQDVLEIVHYSRAWFDGNGRASKIARATSCRWPSRMLSIVDAFDSMTTDHVYRPARSRERALAELFEFAGSQFDPELVRQVQRAVLAGSEPAHREAGPPLAPSLADRTAARCRGSVVEYERSRSCRPIRRRCAVREEADRQHARRRACSSTASRRSCCGTRASSGSPASAAQRRLRPDVPAEPDGHVQQPRAAHCRTKIARSPTRLRPACSGSAASASWAARAGTWRSICTRFRSAATTARSTARRCCCTTFRRETSLEEKCQALHAQVAKDPMTQVANRAEFDRMLNNFVAAHQESNLPCSLIMCDIDHFKIDQRHATATRPATRRSSRSPRCSKSMCRSGDLVARYGGEEFAILCADCTNAAAARKAEAIRQALSEVQAFMPRQRIDHRQLRRHRAASGRHAGNDAAPGRPRAASSQRPGTQPGGPIGRRNDGRNRKESVVAVPVAGAAGRWSKRRS